MNLINMSRELLAQEIRDLAPVVFIGAVLVLFMFFGYVAARIQMAKKYSKKNMPEHIKKHVNYLAFKLRITEVERAKLQTENEGMAARLRGITALALPFKPFVTKEIEDDAIANKTAVKLVHNRVKNTTKKLKLVR